MPRERRLPLGALAGVFALALVGVLLWRFAAPPRGPLEPAWDQVPCARCHMLLSDPAFAAQLHAADGGVLFFDDPGCLLLHRAESRDAPVAVWFHDSAGGGWLAEAEARFVPAPRTPMGYGFAAVAAGGAGAEALEASALLALLRAREGAAP
jgi:copper chaperone NosL